MRLGRLGFLVVTIRASPTGALAELEMLRSLPYFLAPLEFAEVKVKD